MLQFEGLVLVFLFESGVLFGEFVELLEHGGGRLCVGGGGLGEGEFVLQFDHSAIVHVLVPQLFQLHLEALHLLDQLHVDLLQLAVLRRQDFQIFR